MHDVSTCYGQTPPTLPSGDDEWAVIKKYIPYLDFFLHRIAAESVFRAFSRNPNYILLLLCSLPSYIVLVCFFFTVVVC